MCTATVGAPAATSRGSTSCTNTFLIRAHDVVRELWRLRDQIADLRQRPSSCWPGGRPGVKSVQPIGTGQQLCFDCQVTVTRGLFRGVPVVRSSQVERLHDQAACGSSRDSTSNNSMTGQVKGMQDGTDGRHNSIAIRRTGTQPRMQLQPQPGCFNSASACGVQTAQLGPETPLLGMMSPRTKSLLVASPSPWTIRVSKKVSVRQHRLSALRATEVVILRADTTPCMAARMLTEGQGMPRPGSLGRTVWRPAPPVATGSPCTLFPHAPTIRCCPGCTSVWQVWGGVGGGHARQDDGPLPRLRLRSAG